MNNIFLAKIPIKNINGKNKKVKINEMKEKKKEKTENIYKTYVLVKSLVGP